ncbi:MAG: hypothetical protein RMK19_08110 [Bacteroidia bacterium]|nr:hypothetical protein [Bacteroidia bacterium]MDW8015960.1 hypothetical protein [Bacteroidia bacterium]
MNDILEVLTYILKGLLIVAAGFSLGTWWATFRLKKHLRGLLIRWEKPAFGLWTALLFLLLLAFLSAGMIAYAFATKLSAIPTTASLLEEIASLCFLHVSFIVLTYSGLKAHHNYVFCERGIYNIRFCWKRGMWQVELIPWEMLYDYYEQQEGALIRYTLLLRDRRHLIVEAPIHLKDIVDRIINLGLERSALLHKYSHRIGRYSSES